MTCEIKKPNTTEYSFRFDREDEIHRACMWARITLDHDHYCLTAVSDCGDYSYQWQPTPNTESFIELMARINEEYLLNKISDLTVTLIDETKEQLIERLQDWEYELQEDTIDRINEIDNDCSDETFYRECDAILDDADIHNTYELIDMVRDYPSSAKTFCKIFKQYLVPELKKELQPKSKAR